MDDGSPEAPWIDDFGIMRAVLPARVRTPEEVELFAERARRLLSGRTVPLILDARQVPRARPGAFMRAIVNVESLASAVAIVTSTTTPDQVRIYQSQIDAFLIPCRLFSEIEKAEKWIESLGLTDTTPEGE